jgi:hypothetical protein
MVGVYEISIFGPVLQIEKTVGFEIPRGKKNVAIDDETIQIGLRNNTIIGGDFNHHIGNYR